MNRPARRCGCGSKHENQDRHHRDGATSRRSHSYPHLRHRPDSLGANVSRHIRSVKARTSGHLGEHRPLDDAGRHGSLRALLFRWTPNRVETRFAGAANGTTAASVPSGRGCCRPGGDGVEAQHQLLVNGDDGARNGVALAVPPGQVGDGRGVRYSGACPRARIHRLMRACGESSPGNALVAGQIRLAGGSIGASEGIPQMVRRVVACVRWRVVGVGGDADDNARGVFGSRPTSTCASVNPWTLGP
jgi:hypothetical protein